MAEIKLQIGAVADIATSSEVKDACDNLQGHIDKKFDMRRALAPIHRVLVGSTTLPAMVAGNTQVIEFAPGRPSSGRTWAITRVTFTGADDHTAVANVLAAVYTGDPANPYLGGLILPGQAVPSVFTFNKDTVWVHETEAVFVQVSATGNVSAGTAVTINCSMLEYPISSREAGII